ncbi:MAG: STAS domain-containing protein [Azospirillaceae bacterium]|nr:STAS domain-containing protein [Azospirillaceae bacterium]
MPCTHTLRRHDRSLIVALAGDFTFAENVTFLQIVDEVVNSGLEAITIDMSALATIDSAGLSMLVLLRDRLAKIGGVVTLLHPSPPIARILEVVSFEQIFTIVR